MSTENDKMDLNWWKRAPAQMRVLVTSLAAFAATFTTGVAAWPQIEPWVYATRGGMRDHVSTETSKLRREFSPTTAGMYEIQLGIARSRRSSISADIARAEIEVPKSDNTTELLARRAQIDRLKEEKDEVDGEIKRLLVAREKN